jgi:hypothetical protein
MGGKGSFRGGIGEQTNAMGTLDGRWRVEREAGFLPPFGLRKRIENGSGWTLAGGIPLARFRVDGTTLVYTGWPVRDELAPRPDGTWGGRGLLRGREFCRFRLVPGTGRAVSRV